MTRSELISKLAKQFHHLTHSDVDAAVRVILDSISDKLASGGRIEVRGFGSFNLNIRPPRIARNPKTGESVPVPQIAAPHFKPGVELRDRVNKLDE